MCDVRKSVVRLFVMGLAVGLLAGAVAPVNAQKKPQQRRARRETNASRQARIQRTINETYAHRYEVFGGGGFERFRPGEFLKKDNQITWAVNTTYYLNPKLGVIASAQGSFGRAESTQNTAFPNENIIAPKPQINEYYFMAGPSYRFYAKEKFALSAQAQGGIGWGIFGGGSKGIPATDLGLWPDQTRAAFSFGVSADYNIYPNLAVRLTPQYIGTTFGGNVQNNVGFNAGVIYRFGHK
jgi:hypothetical protein